MTACRPRGGWPALTRHFHAGRDQPPTNANRFMPDTMDNMSGQDLPGVPDLLRTWQFPQCPFEMECSAAVLEQIRQEVEQACQSGGDMLETGGVLFGIHDRERVRILAARPLECEHALGAGFVLSEKDELCLAQLMRAPATVPEL